MHRILKLIALSTVLGAAFSAGTARGQKPFYQFDLVGSPGFRALHGKTLTGARREVSINENGRIAFIARYEQASAVVTIGIDLGLQSLTYKDDEQELTDYQFPVINSAGRVVARRIRDERTQLRLFDATNPDAEVDIVYAPPPPNLVSLPALANDGTLGFVRLFDNETTLTDITGDRLDKVDDAKGLLRPAAADGRVFVMRQGTETDGVLVRYQHSGGGAFTRKEIANTNVAAWDTLGDSPGISATGKLVAFTGGSTDFHPATGNPTHPSGVYLALAEAVPGYENPVAICTVDTVIGYDDNATPITFSSFDFRNRVGVIHYEDGPAGIEGDRAVIVFMAKPSKASRDNPALPGRPLLFGLEKAIWTVRVDFEKELKGARIIAHASPPLPVAQIGDSFFGAEVRDLALHDPIAKAENPNESNFFGDGKEDHYLAFWADTTQGEYVVRATRVDTDDDGLPDHWERHGIDMDGDGIADLDLAAMGADPEQKDLFLQINWIPPRTSGAPANWSNELGPTATKKLVQFFADSPIRGVTSPNGIRLHVDAGPGSDKIRKPFSQNMGSGPFLGGEFSEGIRPDILYFGKPGLVDRPGLKARAVDEMRVGAFSKHQNGAREFAFRFCLVGDLFNYEKTNTGNACSLAVVNATATKVRAAENMQPFVDRVALIHSGKGAGQLRHLRRPNGAGLTANEFTVDHAWNPIPDNTSRFAILKTNGGRAEVGFYGDPDYASVSGNDMILTLGMWGVHQLGYLANAKLQSRVILHELGHTLGLRHGGTDHCRYKGTKHLSIMSYTHQNRYEPTAQFRVGLGGAPPLCHEKEDQLASLPGGAFDPIFTYSDGRDDVGYNEWRSLKLGFSRSLPHLGNTFGKDGLNGASNDSPLPDPEPFDVPEPDWEDILEINGPIDLIEPTVRIISPAVAGIPIGQGSEIVIEATDETGVVSVTVGVDMDGNGVVSENEVVLAEHDEGNIYRAQIQLPPRAAAGVRSLRVEAEDDGANIGVASIDVQPALFVERGTFPAQNAGAARQKITFGPVAVPAAGTVRFVVEGSPGSVPGGGQADASVEWINFGGSRIPLELACDDANPNTCSSSWTASGLGLLMGEIDGPVAAEGSAQAGQDYSLAVFFEGDVIGPEIALLDPDARYVLGTMPIVSVAAADDVAIASVAAVFDLNGDGDSADAGETAAAVPDAEGVARITFPTVLTGVPGMRMLKLTARDGSGNSATHEANARVLLDGAGPEVAITFPGSSSAVGVGGTVEVEIEAVDDLGLQKVTASFDRNGDGDMLDAGELVDAESIGGARFRATFGEIGGQPGIRQITATAIDVAAKQAQETSAISVSAGGSGSQTLLTANGTIPAQSGQFGGGSRQTVDLGPVTVPARGLLTFTVTSTPPVRREVRNISRADATIERVTFNGESQPRLRVTCNEFGADPAICTSTWEAPGAGELAIALLGPGTWNTFGEFSGHAAQEYEVEVTFEPIDAAPPIVEFSSPVAGANQSIGQSLTIDLSVRDPSAITEVIVRVDRNGDGDSADAGESVEAEPLGGANFRANIAAVSGNPGARVIEAEAVDAFGNRIVAETYVSVGGSIGGGRQTLLIQSDDFPQMGSAFSGGERQSRPFPSIEIPGPGRVYLEVTASPPVRRATRNIPRFDAAVERIRVDGSFMTLTPDCNDFGADPSVCTTVWDASRRSLLGGEVLGPAIFNVFGEFSGHGAQSYTLKITFAGGPGVASVQPAVGSTGGRSTVTVRGGGFEENAVILFGNVAAADLEFVNATELRCLTPPGIASEVDVTVINPDPENRPFNYGRPYGTFGKLERGFRYETPPPPADPAAERLISTFTGRFPEKHITELQESTQLPFSIPGAGKLRFEAWAFVPILGAIAGPADDPDNLEVHNDSTSIPWFASDDGGTYFMDSVCTPLDFTFGPVICESVRENVPMSAAGSGRIQVRGPAKWSARFKALEVCELLGAPAQDWSIAVWYTPDGIDPGPGENSFTDWQRDRFTFVELLDPQISGAHGDPDRDSVPNAVEFVIDGDPKSPIPTAGLSPTSVATEFFPYPGVEFQVRNDMAGATVTLQASTDLRQWENLYEITSDPGFQSALVVSRTPVAPNSTRIVVRDTLPILLARFPRYFRLAADLAPGNDNNGAASGTTELTFDIDGFGNFQNMDQGYGDRVTSASMGRFSYSGSGQFTPNIEVSYGPDGADPAFWSTGYGDLEGILFEDRDNFGILEVTFTADEGFLVILRRWDMAAFGAAFNSDPVIDAVEVRDGDGSVLHSQTNVSISESNRTRFNFSAQPFAARVLVLRFQSGNLGSLSDDIAIDNVLFGQQPAP